MLLYPAPRYNRMFGSLSSMVALKLLECLIDKVAQGWKSLVGMMTARCLGKAVFIVSLA